MLLKAKNISVEYSIRSGIFSKVVNRANVLDSINLEISTGEIVGLVGESGSGKTTLGLTLLDLEKKSGGSIEYLSRDETKNKNSFRKDYQIIFQDPYSALNPRHTVFEIISEPLLFHKIVSKENVEEKVLEVLEKVGLDKKHLNRYPHAFSGGQRQRICIARVIALNPKLIICDEIVSALDLSVQAQIVELLIKLKKELGLALLWISHDLSIVRNICDRILVMYLGKIVEAGPSDAVFENPSHPYTKALIASIPRLDPKIKPELLKGEIPSVFNRPKGCAFHTRCPKVHDRCKIESPFLEPFENKEVACFYIF